MALFEKVCELDIEGIVAKHSYGLYVAERERSTWVKINRDYSQSVGQEKLFEQERHKEPARAGFAAMWRVRSWKHELFQMIYRSDSNVESPCGKTAVLQYAQVVGSNAAVMLSANPATTTS